LAKYSYEQRLEAVLKVTEQHMSCKAVGRLLGCGDTHVRRWVKRYEKFGVKGLTLKNPSYIVASYRYASERQVTAA